MKAKLLIGMAVVLVSSLALVGCTGMESGLGVPQKEHDEVVAARDALQREYYWLQYRTERAAAYAKFMDFYMGERPETEEEMQAWDAEAQSKLQVLNDTELSALYQQLDQAYTDLRAQGHTEDEITAELMNEYIALFNLVMGKIVKLLG